MLLKKSSLKSNVVLEPHQKGGVNKALANKGRIILNWKPGSGKTLGALAITEALRDSNQAHNTLVVVPASLKNNYYDNGIVKFTNSKGHIIESSRKVIPSNKDYYIVSNELFRTDPSKYLKATNADTVIIDEVQKYKDPLSINYTAMKEVRPTIKNMVLLTGTPFSNHPRDIVPLVDLVTGGDHRLGTYEGFNKKYIQTSTKRYGPLASIGIGPLATEYHLKNKAHLQNALSPVVHTYQEPDPRMPNKTIANVDVPMSREQANVYNYILDKNLSPMVAYKVRHNMPVSKQEAAHIFTALLRARQASNSLHLFDTRLDPALSAEKTPKMKKVLDDAEAHLKKNPKNKIIMYSNFLNGGVDVLSAGLTSRGIKHGVYAGSQHTKPEARHKAVNDYLVGKHRVMVINSAGAEGLNLLGTTMHQSVDGHFNPALIEQAEGRGIRAGSPVKDVEVRRYKSVMPNTILDNLFGRRLEITKNVRGHSVDEWVYQTAERKKQLNDEMQELLKN